MAAASSRKVNPKPFFGRRASHALSSFWARSWFTVTRNRQRWGQLLEENDHGHIQYLQTSPPTFCMVMVTAVPAVAQQKTTLDAVKARGTLIAGVKTDYPPFGYIDEAGKTVGFDIDIVEYIANRLVVKLDLRP